MEERAKRVYEGGNHCWYLDGQYHRDLDLPAILYPDGRQDYYKYGKLHRDNDLPAIIYDIDDNASKEWYQNGLLHRDNNLPARIRYDGSQYWYHHGELIRSSKI